MAGAAIGPHRPYKGQTTLAPTGAHVPELPTLNVKWDEGVMRKKQQRM
jgi:hypothetical protein